MWKTILRFYDLDFSVEVPSDLWELFKSCDAKLEGGVDKLRQVSRREREKKKQQKKNRTFAAKGKKTNKKKN